MHTRCWMHIAFLHTKTQRLLHDFTRGSVSQTIGLYSSVPLQTSISSLHPRPLSPSTSQPASDMQPKGCCIPGMIPYLHDLHFRTYVISQHLLCKSLVKKPERHWLQLLQARELMTTDDN